MDIEVRAVDGIPVIQIAGAVDSNAAGPLYETLVRSVGEGRGRLVVDMSGVGRLTAAGVGGLVVAAKLANTAHGEMRVCGADTSIEAQLRGLGFNHLFHFDPSIEASIAALDRGADLEPSGSVASAAEDANADAKSTNLSITALEQVIESLRVAYARVLIDAVGLPMDRVAASCGYASTAAMHRSFQQLRAGIPPANDTERASAGTVRAVRNTAG